MSDAEKQTILVEYARARSVFHGLLDTATKADLRRPSRGTRWTNEQLLFHMLFGYIIVRTLLVLVRLFGRLPVGVSRAFAWLLNSAVVPFDWVNYVGSRIGARVINQRRMGALFDHTTAALERRLNRETEADLLRGMHYPARWDRFFNDFMTLADVYRYPTQHFDFHGEQLTFGADT